MFIVFFSLLVPIMVPVHLCVVLKPALQEMPVYQHASRGRAIEGRAEERTGHEQKPLKTSASAARWGRKE